MPVDLQYPDGTVVAHVDGITGLEVARSIGPGLAKAAVAVSLNGSLLDLDRPLGSSGEFAVITLDSSEGLDILRHSAAHVLAQAVLDIFPDATFAIGPPIEDGFYYDFSVEEPFTPEDLERISARVEEIIAADQPFQREVMTVDEALSVFADHRFKVEIIKSVDPTEVESSEVVTAYRNVDFIDLCRGPHLPSTGRIPAIKLLRTSGAYWRGDEANEQLQRIYGTAWASQSDLDAYLDRLEEAAKRDHRKLGSELDLYSFPEDLGIGLSVWHPKGGVLRSLVEEHSRRLHANYGFDYVYSPHLAKAGLWETSGHLDFFAENMYPPMQIAEDPEYRVKPMNCPFHVLIYQSRGRSYRDLPMRLAELGGVYRYEKSGQVHGLLRVRGMTQDDSHTFCTEEQLQDELAMHLQFVLNWVRDFGFEDFEADLSTRPEKAIGDPGPWRVTEAALEQSLQTSDIPYTTAPGEGAFYGPKIDVHIRDAIGRRWQCSTIQLDFQTPDRFGLEYVTSDNTTDVPYMIHCAKAGSIERFIGVMVEHYAGAFPMWLAPVQLTVVPVADRHLDYASEVADTLGDAGLRVEVDDANDSLGDKVRTAITQKHPAVIVVGDADVEGRTVGLRFYGEDGDIRGVPLDEAEKSLVEKAARPGE